MHREQLGEPDQELVLSLDLGVTALFLLRRCLLLLFGNSRPHATGAQVASRDAEHCCRGGGDFFVFWRGATRGDWSREEARVPNGVELAPSDEAPCNDPEGPR